MKLGCFSLAVAILANVAVAKELPPPTQLKAPDSESLAPFQETVMVCTNLDMYPVLAAKNRDQGMPLDTAIGLVSTSIKERFDGKIPAAMIPPYIEVVKKIYGSVYSDPKLKPEAYGEAVFDACSGYREYNLDRAALKRELSGYVQSAFDPFSRVPLCVKAGQSAGNVARARDTGMTKQRITEVVSGALANDPG